MAYRGIGARRSEKVAAGGADRKGTGRRPCEDEPVIAEGRARAPVRSRQDAHRVDGPVPTAEDREDSNAALDLAMTAVGDRWTLLVIDALLDGPRRFSELQEAIPGLAPNVLSARLRRLERDGLIAAVRYCDRPPRLEYQVSEAARELAGALRLLARWGARDSGGEVEGPRHRACGTPLEARWYCPT
ncbi:MAG: helix-turn-helix domain-containing protein, partial [Acidimicrobiales bacterium]